GARRRANCVALEAHELRTPRAHTNGRERSSGGIYTRTRLWRNGVLGADHWQFCRHGTQSEPPVVESRQEAQAEHQLRCSTTSAAKQQLYARTASRVFLY